MRLTADVLVLIVFVLLSVALAVFVDPRDISPPKDGDG